MESEGVKTGAPNVVFLHIPKTAGQSLHQGLKQVFGRELVAPLRVNRDFERYGEEQLRAFKVFSGHLDWKRLDFVPEPKVTMTVLRDPKERIASFYLFLRKNAKAAVSAKPENAGSRLGRELMARVSPDEYFSDPDLAERGFVDNHFDNVYTFYFAAREFGAAVRLRRQMRRGVTTEEQVLSMALDNLKRIDLVGHIDSLRELELAFEHKTGMSVSFAERRNNVNEAHPPGARYEQLLSFGLSDATVQRLEEFSRLDQELLRRLEPLE